MKHSGNHLITADDAEYDEIVEHLAEQAFGPGRFTRTAFRLREGVPHEPDLSFLCWINGEIIASVRLTRIKIGEEEALLLGPLVVLPDYKGQGFGAELMQLAVKAAKDRGDLAILLVGDLPYYGKFGFEQVPPGAISLPGPVDPDRLLICNLNLAQGQSLMGFAQSNRKV